MKFEGVFKGGQVLGGGLLTFPDGSHGLPRQEGEWDGGRLIRRGQATDAVSAASDAATKGRTAARIR